MKIIIVRSRAIDPAVNKVAKALADNGYDVKLLLWDRMGNKQTENIDGYTVCRFGFKAPHDKLTVLFYFPIWWLYELFFLLKEDSTIVHACDLDTLLPAIFVKLIKRVKLCYTIYDFYANNLPEGQLQIIRKCVRILVASVEKIGIRFTDVLFLVDESRYEEVKGSKIKELVYIYNSPPDYLNLKDMQKLRDKNEIIIFYSGLITKSRGLEYIIESIKDIDGAKLIMGGVGDDRELFKMIDECKKVSYLGWIPSYDEVIKKSSESDILFRFSDPKIPKTKYESPNKLFEAMMLGKPIIVSDLSSMANIVKRENCGIVVTYGDVHAIRETIINLKLDLQLRKDLGDNGRKAYDTKYSWQIMENRLINIYKKINK